MLLVYQVGSVKIGEVVRYTVTYTPSQDRILPSPERLYLRVRNTSAIALRAAFVHGPYTLSAAAYPSNFDPNVKFANPRRYGVPEFEPMLKAGGSWESELIVPEHIRQSAGTGGGSHFGVSPDHEIESATWIVEVSSQVIFSTSAAVGYEVTIARDAKSLNLSYSLPVIGGQAQVPQPGKVADFQQSLGAKDGHHPAQPKGVFSKAIELKVEDTAALWNTPRLPGWDDLNIDRFKSRPRKDQPVESVAHDSSAPTEKKPEEKQKKVHLVVLTHGLHSNLGADMLYLKESIDSTVAQAKIDAKARRAKERAERKSKEHADTNGASSSQETVPEDDSPAEDDGDDEEVIVRGFSGNATRTERGIKYLGKRLARYVLSMSYPDQPFLPPKKGHAESAVAAVFNKSEPDSNKAAHKYSTIHKEEIQEKRPFTITSISFIGHSLGGLIQTYAVAYIQKHSPEFFNIIKPINFVALATPFLGLSNENPLYVKFALDFGLVGRTGQDLGLTWRAPTIARSGWGAIVSNLGESAHKRVMGEVQPESKPLLRILPTGPAHTALKKFRNRTVYSNVVNDGIVPLRTSCLLFLDWQGLGRVEKARRDAGLVETLVGAGWAELTGGSLAPTPRRTSMLPPEDDATPDDQSGNITPTAPSNAVEVPQPPRNAMMEDDRASLRSVPTPYNEDGPEGGKDANSGGPFAGFFSMFKSSDSSQPKAPPISNKQHKIYRRSQTINFDEISQSSGGSSKVTAGHELERGENRHIAPPRTSFFESAHDLINPKIPTTEYLIDPSKRPRAIFHDRVYQPADIPPPPLKKKPTGSLASRRGTFRRAASTGSGGSRTSTDSSPHPSHRFSHEGTMDSTRDYDDTANTNPNKGADEEIDASQMRVEEKIARAYHRGLAWRKVLVKLEPDAHNNIIVRRMFANAYGWPVVKHLVDAHFSDSATARTRDADEPTGERANDISLPPNKFGDEVNDSGASFTGDGASDVLGTALLSPNSQREAEDVVPDMQPPPKRRSSSRSSSASPPRANRPPRPPERVDSVTWSERDWADSDDSDTTTTTASARSPTSPTGPKDKDKARSSTPLGGWNWTEKIVGRASRKPSSKPEKTNATTVTAPAS
ncbi:serine esterase family protein [Colletotrichum chrysophilum]|uniref:Serine esterase family protein n=1 Tax=Colletotrichum chrysophilum TaxID=1836956 RepID=A0AAD9EBG5_9PEZI|nr:serine esterase family protein [Colletotrichum chrysophilum]